MQQLKQVLKIIDRELQLTPIIPPMTLTTVRYRIGFDNGLPVKTTENGLPDHITEVFTGSATQWLINAENALGRISVIDYTVRRA